MNNNNITITTQVGDITIRGVGSTAIGLNARAEQGGIAIGTNSYAGGIEGDLINGLKQLAVDVPQTGDDITKLITEIKVSQPDENKISNWWEKIKNICIKIGAGVLVKGSIEQLDSLMHIFLKNLH